MTRGTAGLAAAARPLKDLVPGRNEGPFRVAVLGAEVKTARNGNAYLEVEIRDRTAVHKAKCFEGADRAKDFTTGAVVEFRFLVHDAAYGPKFEPDGYRVLREGEYAPREFVPSLPAGEVERYWNEFHGFLDAIRNPHLQALRNKIWGDPERAAKYKWHPSAVVHHHNYLGGNIQHVVGIMRIVEAVTTSYPEIDRDVVIFGAAVHDLGKLEEYEVDTTIRVTDAGKLRGHLVIGAEQLARFAEELRAEGNPVPASLQDHLVHMILSHHGRGEWGSPKPPATAEAMLLHLADFADSQAKGFLQLIDENRDAPDGWFRRWDPKIGESRNVKTRWDEADPTS